MSHAVSPDHGVYLVDCGIVSQSESTIHTYDVANGAHLASFGSRSERESSPQSDVLQLSNFIILADSNLAFSALTAPNRDGGFRVWNYRTGQLLQSLSAPGVLSIIPSPDRKRIAVQFLDELRIYSIFPPDSYRR